MHFKFTNTIPKGYKRSIRIISGPDSIEFHAKEYLILENDHKIISVFEIRYEYSCSPFKEAKILENVLAVGHEEYFYLYNLDSNQDFLKLKVDGYFGHLYLQDDFFYVADASGLHCVDRKGKIIWENNNLAIDGVVVNQVVGDKIYGSGECDPPGGWQNFMLGKHTSLTL